MKILILNRDYPRFLTDLYATQPELVGRSYETQLAARHASLFGMADFYSHAFASLGHSAHEIHVNNRWLQAAWAREHGMRVPEPALPAAQQRQSRLLSALKGMARRALQPTARRFVPRQLTEAERAILAAQIEEMRPDVVLNQDMSYIRIGRLVPLLAPSVRLVGQIAAAWPIGEDFTRYHLIVSSLPNFIARFRALGARAELSRLAFDPRVLDRVPEPAVRDIDVSFVGSVSADHGARVQLLEFLARQVPLRIWGAAVEELPLSSPLRACFEGEAWGTTMFSILRRSRVTINHHIDLAEGYCNNMRLYEATGAGSLLIVDRGRNLSDLFEPESEVLAYSSPEECLAAVQRALRNPADADRIARAGQRRTLSEHSYQHRVAELVALLQTL